MAANVIMPSLGFDMTEGKLANWLKKEGDRVERGQAIAEIETEKATVEIEASIAGVLQKILVPANETVPVGTVIATLAEAGEASPAVSTPATVAPEPVVAKPKASEPKPETRRAEGGDGESPNGERVKASPLARRMATEAGLELAGIKGTGPGGRIMERDIQAASQGRPPRSMPEPTVTRPAPKPAPAPERAPAPAAPRATVPLNKMRQAIARRMTESKTTVPHFYVTIDVNMTEALKVREQLNALGTDKISVNDLVVAAAARTLLAFPNLNASFRDGALEKHPQINIGIAVALEDGLITPVLRDADKKSLKTIAAESKAMAERAKGNKLRSDDIGGGTFTISNLGMFGVDEFIAIINPPEAAILAVGAAVKRAIVDDDDELTIAPMMKVTISVDHRVGDGAQAARFLQALQSLLENPVNLLV